MSYELEFAKPAMEEWSKLDKTIKTQLKKKLIERLETPRIEQSRLSGMPDCYKNKTRERRVSACL
jgi:mRNA interferase RelE/StbE